MSVPYNTGTYYQGPSGPRGKIDFGWISESWQWFSAAAGTWLLATLIYFAASITLSMILSLLFRPLMPVELTRPYIPGPVHYGPTSGQFGQPPFNPYGAQPDPRTALHQIMSQIITGEFKAFPIFMLEGLLLMPLMGLLGACMTNLAVRQVRGERISIGMFFSGSANWLQMTLYLLVYSVSTNLGVIGCIVGSLFVAALFIPGVGAVADGKSAGEAIKESYAAVKGDIFSAVGFVIVFSLLLVPSYVLCGIGLFVTFPMLTITFALAYRDMIGWSMPPGYSPYTQQPGAWPPPPNSGFGGPGNYPPQQGPYGPGNAPPQQGPYGPGNFPPR